MSDKRFSVSVIIPAYNARGYLAYALPAIRKSDYHNFEIIVVDDNSTDDSLEIAKKYADSVIKMNSKVAPGKARNKGAEASSGEILFFIDADVQVASDAISIIVKKMSEDQNLAAVFGSYDDKPFFNDFFSQYKNLFQHFIHQHANPQAKTFWAGCGAIRRDVFFRIGGFPENYDRASIEDVELGCKLKEAGYGVRLLKELQVTHLKRWNFFKLLKSDIVHRAIPWTRLASKRGLPLDLNFKILDRLSGFIACLFLISLILCWFIIQFIPVVIASVIVLLYFNRSLYYFFLKKRGIGFAMFAMFYHWLYLVYSSLTFILFYPIFSFRKPLRKVDDKPSMRKP